MKQENQMELIEFLKDSVEQYKETNEYLKKQNEEQQKQIQELSKTIANLNETVEYLKRELFGTSSEKSKYKDKKDNADEENGFNEVEAYVDPSIEEPTVETLFIEPAKKTRKKKRTRKDILEGLPIVEVLCTLAPEDKICSYCAKEMMVLGKKFIREELRITPAKVERIHYMQETVICPQCKEDDEPVLKSAKTPSPLLKHSLAAPSTVAYVMYQKYVDSLPLYRQSKDWEQMGVALSRETLANWVNTCGILYMKPIYDHMHKLLQSRQFLNVDETTCQVLKEEGKKATSTSYMWLYASGNDGLPPIRLYEYQPGRSGEYPVQFLGDFEGFLTCDGYAGYNKLEKATRCGCLAHMRRYWFNAIPTGRRNHPPKIARLPAEIGFGYCNQLFALEKEYTELSHEERKEQRLKTEVPVWEAYWSWLKTIEPVGGSRLAKANHLHILKYVETVLTFMSDYNGEPEILEILLPWSDHMKKRCSIK